MQRVYQLQWNQIPLLITNIEFQNCSTEDPMIFMKQKKMGCFSKVLSALILGHKYIFLYISKYSF